MTKYINKAYLLLLVVAVVVGQTLGVLKWSKPQHTQFWESVSESNPGFIHCVCTVSRVRFKSLPTLPFVLCSIPGNPSSNLFPLPTRLETNMCAIETPSARGAMMFHCFHRVREHRAKVVVFALRRLGRSVFLCLSKVCYLHFRQRNCDSLLPVCAVRTFAVFLATDIHTRK